MFCIDNVSRDCSIDNIRSFVANLSVTVLSCFETKLRRRRNETAITDRKAFRLRIKNDDRDRLLNPDVWPEYVTISDWFFNQFHSI